MELAMTIHRYTTVSTDSNNCVTLVFFAVSARNSNHHLQGQCEVEGGSGPIFKPLVGRCGVCFYLTWRWPLRLIKPHSSLTHIWAQLLFPFHTHPEGGKYYVHQKLWMLWTQDTAKAQKLTYTLDIGCENKLTGMTDKDYYKKAVGQKICSHGI